MSENSSKLLLHRFQTGDSLAAPEIYARYAKRILGLARQKLIGVLAAKVDPEDIAQDSFQAFFELAQNDEVRWDQEGDLWRLLSAIAVNQVGRQSERYTAAKRNVAREQIIHANDAEFQFDVVDSSAADPLAAKELEELVDEILANEKPLAKRILTFRLAGMTLDEIAERTKRSERTIRRVLQTLKSRFAATHGFEEPAMDVVSVDEHTTSALNAKHADYDLLRMIGVGSFGKIYLARNNSTGGMVAIKVLKKSWIGDLSAERLFLNEAVQLSNISHPNIVGFLEAGPLPNGSWFIVLEYFNGKNLSNACVANIEPARMLSQIAGLASALDYLHGMGVTHGDLKPANILVDNGQSKLVDFGFSVLRSKPSKTLVGGTPEFIAPETRASAESDIYSFGKVIEFMIGRINPNESNALTLLKQLAEEATNSDPQERPSAQIVLCRVKAIAKQLIAR